MIKMKFVILLFVGWSFIGHSQIDTSVTIISKIDFLPQYQLHDNKEILLMGYSINIGGGLDLPSPTLEFKENDSVQLNMWNLSQGPPHTIHLHGLDVNQENDGVPMLSYAIEHDDTGSYYFEAPHPGTYLYHCHETSVLHVQSGMYGMLIVRPQSADTLTWENGYSFHSERAWLTSEIDTNWHNDSIIHHPHDTTATTHLILDYKPQHFLINGKSEQQLLNTVEIVASVGEIVYMRLANIGYYGTRFIFPTGLNAKSISSDGRPLPSEYVSDTIDILPGERFGVLIESQTEFQDLVNVEYFDLNTGIVADTQQIEVDINGFVGINELEFDEPLIYPNPASSELSIVLPNGKTGPFQVQIQNMLGQNVLEQNNATKTINLSALTDGTYILKISHQNKQWNQKLIINQ